VRVSRVVREEGVGEELQAEVRELVVVGVAKVKMATEGEVLVLLLLVVVVVVQVVVVVL